VTVLLTGGCGYVGTVLTEALLDRTNHDVVVIDAQWFGNYLPSHPRLTVIKMDVREIDEVDLGQFDVIIHLANIANDPSVELNPYASWEVNVLATMRMADRAARQGVKQFIFASSSSVYGVKSEPRVTEDLELVPISEYNKTKMVAERVILSYQDRMITTLIRPATVCGFSPRMRLDVVVNLLTMQALERGRMTVLGGDQVRPNIHMDDLVDLYLYSIANRLSGVYNAGFENIAVMEIARLVAAHVPAEIAVLPSDDPRSYSVCSDKLLATGFAPKRKVDDAIREMVAAFRDGRLTNRPEWHNVKWMKQQALGGPAA
jgi:nucleoside-diphosphate-sugar epimerase